MSGLLLSTEEKWRFSRWLENEITTTRGLMEQMKKISVPELLLKQYDIRATAFSVVLQYINSGIEETI